MNKQQTNLIIDLYEKYKVPTITLLEDAIKIEDEIRMREIQKHNDFKKTYMYLSIGYVQDKCKRGMYK